MVFMSLYRHTGHWTDKGFLDIYHHELKCLFDISIYRLNVINCMCTTVCMTST